MSQSSRMSDLSPIAIRSGSYAAFAAGAVALLSVMASAQGQGQGPRSVAGVYSEPQAARGQALYGQRCAGCHGPTLSGGTAPALAGDAFTARWRLEPLSALFIKIRHTMPPPAAPPPLTPEQAVDVVAHVLKSNGVTAGTSELPAADAGSSMAAWPGAPGTVPRTAAAIRAYAPAGTLAQLMRGVFFPSSNLIFTVQTRDPAAPVPPPSPASQGQGFSVFEWGQGIYTGWPVIENAATALADASLLMVATGLQCENGRPAPIDDAEWIRYTDEMITVSKRIHRLAQTRDQEAVSDATGDLSDACAACHRAYRDVGGRGRGAAPGVAAISGRCAPRK